MNRAWRLLEHGASEGPWNMGVDEALLASAQQGLASLRLYRWAGPWLSLGYGQSLSSERMRECEDAGVGFVQRTTGGRAVLHGQDLTYAVAVPEACLPPTLQGAYDWVAGVLCDALRRLEIDAVRTSADAQIPGREVFDCFAQPAPQEICVAGRKLAGSAQRRVKGAVLQHGSIRLCADPAVAARASGLLGAGATSLAELEPARSVSLLERDLRGALIACFEDRLETPFARQELSTGERTQAQQRSGSPDKRS